MGMEQGKPAADLIQPPEPAEEELRRATAAFQGVEGPVARTEPPAPDEGQLRRLMGAQEAVSAAETEPPPPDEEQLRRAMGSR